MRLNLPMTLSLSSLFALSLSACSAPQPLCAGVRLEPLPQEVTAQARSQTSSEHFSRVQSWLQRGQSLLEKSTQR